MFLFCFQYIAVSKVSATMGHGDVGGFHFGIQIWIFVAFLAAAPKRLRFI